MVLAHELNGVLVLSVGVLINVDIMKKVYTIEGNSNDDMCRQKRI